MQRPGRPVSQYALLDPAWATGKGVELAVLGNQQGVSIADSSPYKRKGLATNVGCSGDVLRFFGTSWVDMGTVIPEPTYGFTVIADISLLAAGSYPMIASRGPGTGPRWELAGGFGNNRVPYFAMGTATNVSFGSALTLGVRTTLAVVCRPGVSTVYRDGVAVNSGAQDPYTTAGATVYIGRRADGYYANMRLHRLLICNKAWSAREIAKDSEAPYAGWGRAAWEQRVRVVSVGTRRFNQGIWTPGTNVGVC